MTEVNEGSQRRDSLKDEMNEDTGGGPVLGGRHDDVAKSLSHAPGALSPGDNRRDGTGMVPSIIIADAGS